MYNLTYIKDVVITFAFFSSCSFIVDPKPAHKEASIDNYEEIFIVNEYMNDFFNSKEDIIDFSVDYNDDISDFSIECLPSGYEGTCNIVYNCGCSRNLNCKFYFDSSNCNKSEICTNINGNLGIGEQCDPFNDYCEVGSGCVFDLVSAKYVCQKFCFSDDDCDTGYSCINNSFYNEHCGIINLSPYKLCNLRCSEDKRCDPFTSSGCNFPNEACAYDLKCGILFCRPVGSYFSGEICNTILDCKEGMQRSASPKNGINYCFNFCDENHICSSGYCSTFNPPYYLNPTLGICVK